jgi:hypothetical protein
VSDGDVSAILAEIHEGLADDGVYVHPSFASQVTDAQLAEVVDNLQALGAAGEPTYVVLYPLVDGDPFSANPQDLVARLHDAYPEAGQYLTTTRALQYGTQDGVTLDGRSYGVGGTRDGAMSEDALWVLSYEQHPSVGDAAVRATDLMLEPPAEVSALLEEVREASPYYSGGSYDDGGTSGWVVAGIVLAVVLAAAWCVVRLRRSWVRDTSAAPAFTLPASTVDRIRDAHDRRLEREARDEVLALGEALDATEIGPRHDRTSWQAALDQYDAARHTLDVAKDPEDPELLDVVGALVLARRGRAALAAATSGRPWSPTTGCYLTPLHAAATERRRLRSAAGPGGAEQAVPVCAECRADLAAGRTPDVLDVVHRGVPRHYFETDVEPWAGTGYGALEPDLVQALHRTRR